jgi:hypothetical protein
MSTDLLHRMYDFLGSARDVAVNTHHEKDRINDLVIYTRALDLAFIAQSLAANSVVREDTLYELSQLLYRTRFSFMYDFFAFFNDDLFPELASVLQTRCSAFGTGEGLNALTINNYAHSCSPPWSTAAVSDAEIATWVSQGLARNPPFPFTPIYYPMDDLAITTSFNADPRGRKGEGPGAETFRATVSGSNDWILKTKADQALLSMKLKASCPPTAQCGSYAATVEVHEADVSTGVNVFIDSFTAPADGIAVAHDFTLKPSTLYRVSVLNTTALVTPWLAWDETQYHIVTVPQQGENWHFMANNYFYFYVPRSNTSLVAYLGVSGSAIYRPDGTSATIVAQDGKYTTVDVPEADRGKVWMLYCKGTGVTTNGCYLMNAPSQFSRSPRELLIQQSLIDADGLAP